MTVTYTNRKGKTYYLHTATTKSGRTSYFFSMKEEDPLVDEIPQGYEIYEHPNGQVFLRQARPKIMSDAEVALVEREVKRHAHLRYCLVEVRGKAIVLFEPNQDVKRLSMVLDLFPGRSGVDKDEFLAQNLSYSAVMRFVLVDPDRRFFVAERYCYRGSIDD